MNAYTYTMYVQEPVDVSRSFGSPELYLQMVASQRVGAGK